MTRRIVLTGPECSGKSTLARSLATALAAPCTPEAARLFAEAIHPTPLSAETVEPIARLAMRLADEAAAQHPAAIVHDTDLISTVVYARHYYGSCPAWIEQEARARLADQYLLCLPDLPWQADGVRDRPISRQSMLASFRAALAEFGAASVDISGFGAVRERAARRAVGLPEN